MKTPVWAAEDYGTAVDPIHLLPVTVEGNIWQQDQMSGLR